MEWRRVPKVVAVSDTLPEFLTPFLDLVDFPAARWELLIAAEQYGADLRTRTALRALSCGSYAHPQAVARELAQNLRTMRGPAGEHVVRVLRSHDRGAPARRDVSGTVQA